MGTETLTKEEYDFIKECFRWNNYYSSNISYTDEFERKSMYESKLERKQKQEIILEKIKKIINMEVKLNNV